MTRAFNAPTAAIGTDIRDDQTWQRALEIVIDETVPELRGRWAQRRIEAPIAGPASRRR